MRSKDRCSHEHLHTYTYNSSADNCPELATTQHPLTDEQVKKQWPAHTTNPTWQREGTCDDTDESHMFPAK